MTSPLLPPPLLLASFVVCCDSLQIVSYVRFCFNSHAPTFFSFLLAFFLFVVVPKTSSISSLHPSCPLHTPTSIGIHFFLFGCALVAPTADDTTGLSEQICKTYPALKAAKKDFTFGYKIEYENLDEKQDVTILSEDMNSGGMAGPAGRTAQRVQPPGRVGNK